MEVFAPLIAGLAELCFRDGVYPTRYKSAMVTVLLKKTLDRDDGANYRPISNLHTISKIVQRLVLSTGRAKKSNPLGKIRYLWNCCRFFAKFTAFIEEDSGHICCEFHYKN